LKSLFAAQIPLRGFDRNMSEKKLNLFEFTASLMAKASASPVQVMRGKAGQAATGGTLLDDGPDHLWRKAVSPRAPSLVDGSEQGPEVIPAGTTHSSIALFTQCRIGTVRM
jgi:hypothetical protein